MVYKKITHFDYEIVVKVTQGVFYIYINDVFYCSCANWQECTEEIGEILNETI